VAPGATITLVGSGYAAHSTVTLTAYSKATVLGTAVTDARGSFSATVTVPPALAGEDHTFVSLGVAPDGTARAMKLVVTVKPHAGDGGGGLPVTGANGAWIALAALIVIAGGALLRRAAR
jgi:hypothetical protein